MSIGQWNVARGIVVLAVAAGCTLTERMPRNFEDCVRAGYPVMEIYPRRCAVPGGPTFAEPWAGPPEITPVPQAPDLIGEPTWGVERGLHRDRGPHRRAGGCRSRLASSSASTAFWATRAPTLPDPPGIHRPSCVAGLRAWQETEMACIAVIEPFDLQVPLERPLTAGVWTIEGGGLTTTYSVPGFDD